MTSASEVSHALRNGAVEAGALTLDETLNLLEDGVDLRVILVMDVSNGADVLLARDDIHDLAALRGRRIGVEEGATGALMLDAALQAAHLTAADIQLVPLTVNEHVSAWNAGKIDALVTFEPVASVLLVRGAHRLFDSSQIPRRIVDVLVVRDEYAETHPQQLKALLAGHFAALEFLAQKPEEASARMSRRLAVPPPQVLEQLKGMQFPDAQQNRQWLAGPQPWLPLRSAELRDLMQQRHLLESKVEVSRLTLPAFLPELR
jgi:NitT/TauT family transport system substrate-binding protein